MKQRRLVRDYEDRNQCHRDGLYRNDTNYGEDWPDSEEIMIFKTGS